MKRKFLIIGLAMGSLGFGQVLDLTCISKTKKGTDCKIKVKDSLQPYCHHHLIRVFESGDTVWVKKRTSKTCSGTTKRNEPCKLKTKDASGKCHHHRD